MPLLTITAAGLPFRTRDDFSNRLWRDQSHPAFANVRLKREARPLRVAQRDFLLSNK